MPTVRPAIGQPRRLPQHAQKGIVRELNDSLTGDPGLRLLETTSKPSRLYTGGALTPQRFIRPPASAVGPEALELASVKIVTRRSYGRTRGRPA